MKTKKNNIIQVFLFLIIFTWFSPVSLAQSSYSRPVSEMSMEELMQVEVTSVSKRPQSLQSTAAAVYVITSEQIKNSTARNIPDLLRTVPGVNVSQFDGNKWAVSIRGFNRVFANQLLVLVDGKTTYTQLFSGVYWDTVDTPLEDIERIEVIRGPGAAVWGANAVNGVINIITKSAADTHGTYIRAGSGNLQNLGFTMRYGESIGESSDIRYWARVSDYSNLNSDQGIDANDGSENYRGGIRFDSDLGNSKTLSFQLNGYRDNHRSTAMTSSPISSNDIFVQRSDYGAGFTLQGEYTNFSDTKNIWEIKSFFDRFMREDIGLNYYVNTADIEIQNTNKYISDLTLVSGIGARILSDELFNSELANLYTDDTSQNSSLINLFFQADYQLIPEKLNLTLGSKVEYVTYTGFEAEPNLRLGYQINDNDFIWSSFSRAARVPSRADDSVTFIDYSNLDPSTGMPFSITNLPNDDLDSEITYAYESGYRSSISKDLTFDLALFINNYQNQIATVPGEPRAFATAYGIQLDQPVTNQNAYHAESKGAEVAVSWKPKDNLDFKLAYSIFDLSIAADKDRPLGTTSNIKNEGSPDQTFSLLTEYRANDKLDLSAWISYVGSEADFDINSYWRLDLKAKYYLLENVNISIYGANLIEEHAENRIGYLLQNTEIPRSVYGAIEVKF